MRDIPYDLVTDALDAAGLYLRDEYTERGDTNVVNIRNDYSGRYMYGERCFGIDFEGSPEMMSWMAAFAVRLERYRDDYDEGLLHTQAAPPIDPIEFAGDTRTDNMGMGMIAYWPSYQLVDLPPELRDEPQEEVEVDA